jgi:transmembrane 9 superfamily member 2/4
VCPPSGEKHSGSKYASGYSVALNLGEVLRGDRIKNSDLEVNMGQDVECQYLCDRVASRQDVQWARNLVDEGYVAEWILDNLPGATSFVTVDRSKKYYSSGFKLGSKEYDANTGKPEYLINNHFTIVVRWRKAPGRAGDNGGKVVVAFEVYPKSINSGQRNATGCPLDVQADHKPFELYIPPKSTDLREQYPDSSYVPEEAIDMYDGATLIIPYTYSIYFRESDEIEWEHRWDLYFSDQAETSFTHWLAIVNSLIISGILGAVCIVIWGRTMHGDVKGRGDGVLEEARLKVKRTVLKKSSSGLLEKLGEAGPDGDVSDEEVGEDLSGWKLLHGDVFRPPMFGGFLAPLVGSGIQLIFMVAGLLVLSTFGVLNPSWRGGFISVGIGLFVFAGSFSGYFSARVYKTFGGQNYKKNTALVSLKGLIWRAVLTQLTDCSSLPWTGVHIHLCAQPFHMGTSFVNGPSIFDTSGPDLPLAPDTSSPSPLGLLLWVLPICRLGTPDAHEQHPAADPAPAVVYTESADATTAHGPYPLRGSLHRAPIRLQVSLP